MDDGDIGMQGEIEKGEIGVWFFICDQLSGEGSPPKEWHPV